MTESYKTSRSGGGTVAAEDQWTRKKIAAAQRETERTYWRERLSGELTRTAFPHDHLQASGAGRELATESLTVPEAIGERLLAVSKGSDPALHVLLASITAALTAKYSGLRDIILQTPIYRQAQTGSYMNTVLFLRSDLEAADHLKALVMQTRERVREAGAHANYPMDVLADELTGSTDLRLLSEVAIVLDSVQSAQDLPSDSWELLFGFRREGGGVQGELRYNQRFLDQETAARIAAHWSKLAGAMLDDPGRPLAEISLLSEEDTQRMLRRFNGRADEPYAYRFLHELLDTHAAQTPNRTAVVCGEAHMTYRELADASSRLAHLLREKGVGREDLVAILSPRSIPFLVGILAVWKAGGAYVPLDPDYPEERLQTILGDSRASLVLTVGEIAEGTDLLSRVLQAVPQPCEALRIDDGASDGYPSHTPELERDLHDLSYVIYTSGSTGRPKGAMLEHVGMLNHMLAMMEELAIDETSRIVQNASQCFDISVWQFVTALAAGGETHIFRNELIMQPEALLERLVSREITVLQAVPTYLSILLETAELNRIRLPKMKTVSVTGEKLTTALARRWFNQFPEIPLINAYGPTEASDDVTLHVLRGMPDAQQIPVGRPIRNVTIYILDEQRQPCPIGVKGEICVSGLAVGRGYLHDEERTKLAFGEDHLAAMPGVRLYRTGDIGRWLPDGTIEYAGRMDDQVKVRGFRIELKEIEHVLAEYAGVKEAAVIVRRDEASEDYLCAYLTATERLSATEVQQHVGRALPHFMVPKFVVQLEQMPVTPNGKIDRKNLPDPATAVTLPTGSGDGPLSELEQRLVEVCSEVLGLPDFGADDHFFNVGGDSIHAIQVAARLQKYRLLLDIRDIFRYPTVRGMAGAVKESMRSIDQGPVVGEAGLTPVQRWFFEQFATDLHHHNQAALIYTREGLEEERVRQVFGRIAEHHDALRMTYRLADDGSMQQMNEGPDAARFELATMRSTGTEEQEVMMEVTQLAERLQASMKLETGPLVKLGLVHAEQGDYLVICIHHLVIDGISWRILFEDFESGYRQAERDEPVVFPDKTDAYRDWAERLQTYATSEALLRQLPYWEEVESQPYAALAPDLQSEETPRYKDARAVYMELAPSYTEQLLGGVHEAYHTEINDLLCTALAQAFKQWRGLDGILVNVEGHGRESIIEQFNINRTIGWFTSQFPVALSAAGTDDPGKAIIATKEMLRRIPERGIGYGILRYLTPDENKTGYRIGMDPPVNFNYLGQFESQAEDQRFQVKAMKLGDPKSVMELGRTLSDNMEMPVKINIEGEIRDGRLVLCFGYNQTQYTEEAIGELAEHYRHELIRLVEHCAGTEQARHTPSDFKHADLSEGDLDDLQSLIDEIEE